MKKEMKQLYVLLGIILFAPALQAMNKAQIEQFLSSLQHFSKIQSLETLENLRNPFEHNLTQETLELYAIINGKALINGEWLHKGEKIRGYTILDIHTQYILVQKGKLIQKIPIGKGIDENIHTNNNKKNDLDEGVAKE
ncbi:MAG: hypothetical protein J1E28_03920 [Helicobacter sp.]|uniref:hypothetical protein n=1 Tax=Helicobacter sp. TaxID=218 RepID=UPI0025B86C25|nr:hypothetical protein [Helicobacter sp.]MCH5313531.1 hypothetical protein [Helicobacter sp.]